MPEGFLSGSYLAIVLVIFLVLTLAELLTLYLHLAGFTVMEVVLLVALPLFAYLSAFPVVGTVAQDFGTSVFGVAINVPRVFDIAVLQVNQATIGVNLIGVSVPAIVTAKLLWQRRVPWLETCLLVAVIAGVSYLYTRFQPGLGMVVHFFAIPPMLAAAIAFMLSKIRKGRPFNPALLSYTGATIGMLVGADLLNLPRVVSHYRDQSVFISIGGGGMLDAIFLAGIVALLADILFRSQEEDLIGNFAKLFRRGSRR